MKIKSNKGVTLIALVITIVMIIIITGAMIFNTKGQIYMKKINDLHKDIDVLSSKVDEYYLKYGELPILCDYIVLDSNSANNTRYSFSDEIINNASNKNAKINMPVNLNDGNRYCVIDIEQFDGITLNYGYDEQYSAVKTNVSNNRTNPPPAIKEIKNINSSTIEAIYYDEIYIINTVTHQIYFPHGIIADGTMYYTF